MYELNRFTITLSGLILLASVNLVNTSDPTSKNDNANEQHNAMDAGYFLIVLVLCIVVILFVLIAITVYCCKVRNEFNTIDLPFSQSEETFRMSVKEHEKSCSSAIDIPAPFPKVHSQSVPIPKVRSHSCSDFVPHDESFRPSYRQPTKKPNINIIIGEETRHCSPFPVPDKMSRRNTVGSRPMRNVRFDTFPCPQRVSKNPFQRQLSLPASVRTELRTEVRSPSNPFKQSDYVQSCPFT